MEEVALNVNYFQENEQGILWDYYRQFKYRTFHGEGACILPGQVEAGTVWAGGHHTDLHITSGQVKLRRGCGLPSEPCLLPNWL